MRHALLAVVLGLTSYSAMAGAGHGEDSKGRATTDIDRTITVKTGDLWFKPDDLSVAPGETVEFIVKNVGNLAHEFVIGGAEEQAEHREMMQSMASQGGGHDMASGHHDAMASSQAMPSISVAPGETRTLVWTAPDTSNAALVYACNIPGHYEAGMKGELEIQG